MATSTQVIDAIPIAAVVKKDNDKQAPGWIMIEPSVSSLYFAGLIEDAATTAPIGRNHSGVDANVAAASALPAESSTEPPAMAL